MSDEGCQKIPEAEVTPETALDVRLKAMYAAMRPSAGTTLPDLASLPRSGVTPGAETP